MRARVCQRCGKITAGECCKSKAVQQTARNGYGRRWQKFRQALIRKRARQGKLRCGMCDRPFGAESPHGDHIFPVQDESDPLFYDEGNIQFLHPACHGEKTQEDVMRGLTR